MQEGSDGLYLALHSAIERKLTGGNSNMALETRDEVDQNYSNDGMDDADINSFLNDKSENQDLLSSEDEGGLLDFRPWEGLKTMNNNYESVFGSGELTDDKRMKYEDPGNLDGDLNGSKTQESMDRRRERNRLLARKTRQRKKVFYEALQRQVAQLVKENEILKGIVQTRKTTERKPVVSTILQQDLSLIPQDVTLGGVTQDCATILERADYRLVSAIQASQRSFCITNPALPDNPIVFASKGFLDLTGYRLDQILGRNARFLQGPGTDRRQIDAMRKGIAAGVDTSVCLLNYRADGSTFYNQMFLAPLRDKLHKIVNYVGVQVEVQVQLSESADRKKPLVEIKPEKKDFKDEEKDYPTYLDAEVLENIKAPTKETTYKRFMDEATFDFDDFL
eukprot:gene3775-7498_t